MLLPRQLQIKQHSTLQAVLLCCLKFSKAVDFQSRNLLKSLLFFLGVFPVFASLSGLLSAVGTLKGGKCLLPGDYSLFVWQYWNYVDMR